MEPEKFYKWDKVDALDCTAGAILKDHIERPGPGSSKIMQGKQYTSCLSNT